MKKAMFAISTVILATLIPSPHIDKKISSIEKKIVQRLETVIDSEGSGMKQKQGRFIYDIISRPVPVLDKEGNIKCVTVEDTIFADIKLINYKRSDFLILDLVLKRASQNAKAIEVTIERYESRRDRSWLNRKKKIYKIYYNKAEWVYGNEPKSEEEIKKNYFQVLKKIQKNF